MMKHVLLGLLAAQTALSTRFVMYIDQYAPIILPTSLSMILTAMADTTRKTSPAKTSQKA